VNTPPDLPHLLHVFLPDVAIVIKRKAKGNYGLYAVIATKRLFIDDGKYYFTKCYLSIE
jgi:hypothetical protein